MPEHPLDAVDNRQHVEALTAPFASMAKSTRPAIDTAASFGDADTADLFTEVSRELDKQLWFLVAHLTSWQEPCSAAQINSTQKGRKLCLETIVVRNSVKRAC